MRDFKRIMVVTVAMILVSTTILCASAQIDTSEYLAQKDFMYADNPRYICFGGTPRRTTELQVLPTVGLGVGYAALVIGLHVNQSNAWWRDNTGSFHFVEDIQYAKGLDKAGHAYSGYAMTSFCSDLLMECGVSYKPAIWYGAGMGLAYMTYVEVQDGFAKDWGFSPTDAASNVLGVGIYLAQQYIPFIQNFTPRWSYIPTNWVGNNMINKRPKTFIDDYNGTTMWVAMNINNMLPVSLESYWPDWMMLSIGYGIDNYAVDDINGQPLPVKSKFLIGIDYDWVKILPDMSGVLNYMKQILNHIRIPGPTLEITSTGVRFGVLYPFAIVVPL